MVKTIRQAMAECSLEQLSSIGRLWLLPEIEQKQNRTTYQNQIVDRMQDASAARLLWEQLSADERAVLHQVLQPASRYGEMRDALQKKVNLSPERFEAALQRLVSNLLVQTYTVSPSTGVVTSKKQAKEEKAPLLVIAAFNDSMKTLYAIAQEFAQDARDRSKLKLDKILATLTDIDTDHILRHFKMTQYRYRTRPEDRFAIAEEILTRENLLEEFEEVSAEARAVFKWVYDQGGKVSMQRVREHSGLDNIALLDLLHTFTWHALAFDTFSKKEYVLFVPQEVYLNIKNSSQPVEPDAKSELQLLDTAPAVIRADEPAMLYDIATLVNAVFQQTIEPTLQGRLPKRLAGKLRPLLRGLSRTDYEGYDTYTDMLFGIMKHLNIVRLTKPAFVDDKAHYEIGKNFAGWAELDMLAQTKLVLANSWLTKHTLVDIVTVHDQESYNEFYNLRTALAQPTLVKYLSACRPEHWYSISSLLDMIWQNDPYVLRLSPPRARQADRKKGSELYKKWLRLEGNVYLGILSSSLYEMGIVSLGYTQAENADKDHRQLPDSFLVSNLGAKAIEWMHKEVMDRFNELQERQRSRGFGMSSLLTGQSDLLVDFSDPDFWAGEVGVFEDEEDYEYDDDDDALVEKVGMELLQRDPQQKRTTARMLVVQPNFELLIMQPDFPTLYSVLPFAQVNQVGLVSRLTLTKASLQRGLQNGLSNEQMLQVLKEHSQKELPQNVLYTIQDWTKGFKSATAMQVLLLDVSGEDVIKMMQNAKVLADFGLRTLGPTTIAITEPINVRELKRQLEKLGIFTSIKGTISHYAPPREELMYGRYQ